MECPKCEKELKRIIISGVKVDRCQNCGGLWFDRDELKIVRDHRDKNLSWLEFDLWEDKRKLLVSGRSVDCPRDGKPLFKIKYGDTNVMVDVCLDCRGIWLDKDEFEKIVTVLKEEVNSETIPEYLNDLKDEVKEFAMHPSQAATELRHVIIIMKLLEYRFAAKHPEIIEMISILPD